MVNLLLLMKSQMEVIKAVIATLSGAKGKQSRFWNWCRILSTVLVFTFATTSTLVGTVPFGDSPQLTAQLAPSSRFVHRGYVDSLSQTVWIRGKDGSLIKEPVGYSGRWIGIDKRSGERKGFLFNQVFMRVMKSFSIAMKESGHSFDKANLIVVDHIESHVPYGKGRLYKDNARGFAVFFPEDTLLPVELVITLDFAKFGRLEGRSILKEALENCRKGTLVCDYERQEGALGEAHVAPPQGSDARKTNILFLETETRGYVAHAVYPWAFYLASAVKRSYANSGEGDKLKIEFAMCSKRNSFNEEEIKGLIKEKDIIALTLHDQEFHRISELIGIIRRHSNALIAIGGPMATASPEQVAALLPKANIIVRGEGEEVFPQIVKALRDSSLERGFTEEAIERLRAIPQGVMVRVNDIFICNNINRQGLIFDLDKVELDFTLLDETHLKGKGIRLNTARGCPYHCTFCSRVHGRGFRSMKAGRIIEHIRSYSRRLDELSVPLDSRVRSIVIDDDDFLLDPERATEFLEALEREFGGRLWLQALQTSIHTLFIKDDRGRYLLDNNGRRVINQGLLEAINRPRIFQLGFPMLFIGTDGFTDRELRRFNKGYTMDEVKRVVRALEGNGIAGLHYWIMSNPDTSLVDFVSSILNIADLKMRSSPSFIIDYINPYVMPFTGTVVLRQIQKREIDLDERRVAKEREDAGAEFEEFSHTFIDHVYPSSVFDSDESDGPPFTRFRDRKRLLRSIKDFYTYAFEGWPTTLEEPQCIALACYAFIYIVYRYNYLIAKGGDLATKAKEEVKEIEREGTGIDELYKFSLAFLKIIVDYTERLLEGLEAGSKSSGISEKDAVKYMRILRRLRFLFLAYPESKWTEKIERHIKNRFSRFAASESLPASVREEVSKLLNPDIDDEYNHRLPAPFPKGPDISLTPLPDKAQLLRENP